MKNKLSSIFGGIALALTILLSFVGIAQEANAWTLSGSNLMWQSPYMGGYGGYGNYGYGGYGNTYGLGSYYPYTGWYNNYYNQYAMDPSRYMMGLNYPSYGYGNFGGYGMYGGYGYGMGHGYGNCNAGGSGCYGYGSGYGIPYGNYGYTYYPQMNLYPYYGSGYQPYGCLPSWYYGYNPWATLGQCFGGMGMMGGGGCC